MKASSVSLFLCFSLLSCGAGAFSAPQHSWLVVTTSVGGDGITPFKEQLIAIRDDGKVRRTIRAKLPAKRIFSLDGQRWLEVRHVDGGSVLAQSNQLYVGTVGDSRLKKLVDNDFLIRDAQWTPDGKILLASGFINWSAGNQRFVYSLVDPNTGATLTDFADFREVGKMDEGPASLSPDGSHLLVLEGDGAIGGPAADYIYDPSAHLLCLNLKAKDSLKKSNMIAHFIGFYGAPVWKPDGTQFVFAAASAWSRDGDSRFYNLYSYSMKYERLCQFTYSRFSNYSPTWSPNGKRIAWISNRPLQKGTKPGKSHLYTMSADGTGQKLLAANVGNADSVRWQKDEPK